MSESLPIWNGRLVRLKDGMLQLSRVDKHDDFDTSYEASLVPATGELDPAAPVWLVPRRPKDYPDPRGPAPVVWCSFLEMQSPAGTCSVVLMLAGRDYFTLTGGPGNDTMRIQLAFELPVFLRHVGTHQVNEICRLVAELPDRSSPASNPNLMLVTVEELDSIIRSVLHLS